MQAGRLNTLNLNTATFASPTWVAAGRASSPSFTHGRPTSRKTFRSAATSKNVTGLRDFQISGSYIAAAAGVTDAVLDDLMDSLINDTVLDVAVLDGPASSGAKGFRGPFVVSQLDKSEDDEDASSYEFTLVEVEDSTIGEVDEYTIA